jgi:DNA-binding NarL/FixJ family response regulator
LALRILFADGQQAIRKALKSVIDGSARSEVGRGTAQDPPAAQPREQPPQPQLDVVVFDPAVPVMDGLRAARKISAAFPRTSIFIRTNHQSIDMALEAKREAARQVLSKGASSQELIAAIDTLLPPELRGPPPEKPKAPGQDPHKDPPEGSG